MNRPGEILVFSTRWLDNKASEYPKGYKSAERPAAAVTLEIRIQNEQRHEALAQRQSLTTWLKREARPSH